MAPLTPFFTEVLYQNLRRVSEGAEESIHYCGFPEEEGKGDERIVESVSRMTRIIDLARNIRERHNKPLKTPLREMVIVHPDNDFLDDIAGKLREYVLEELNIRSLVPCNDPLKYASLRAEPDFSVLGKRLGKSMGVVAKEVKGMCQKDILAFEEAGELTIAGHCLKLSDIKVLRDFKCPDNTTEEEIDAAGDSDVLVILDLRPDDSLFESGVARELSSELSNCVKVSYPVHCHGRLNNVQKLRKKASLEPTDVVEVYFSPLEKDASTLKQVLSSQEQYVRDAIGSHLLLPETRPSHAVIFCEETFHGVYDMSFTISLSTPSLVFNDEALLSLYEGNSSFAQGLQAYLRSRDYNSLKSEFQSGNGKIRVDCIKDQPPVDVVLGQHVFLSVGDHYISTKSA